MTPQLVVAVVAVAPDGRVLEGPVHALNLSVRPGMARLSQSVIDVVLGTGELERMRPEDLASLIRGAAELVLPGVVKWVPLSVSTVWILKGTAAISARRKSPATRRVTFSCN